MRYLHTMVRVADLEKSLAFYCGALGLTEVRRTDHAQGRFTLVFLAAPADVSGDGSSAVIGDVVNANAPQVELTHNWDEHAYTGGRNFGHLAYAVDDIYAACERLIAHGVVISRPPRDGRMAFVRSPDEISIELLQRGPALAPKEPWLSMPNVGAW